MRQTCHETTPLNILVNESMAWPDTLPRIVRETLARYDWQLAEGLEFVAQVRAEVDRRGAARRYHELDPAARQRVVEEAVKYCYSLTLYRACLANGTWQQQRAYQELGRYLFRIAYNKFLGCPDAYGLAEECTQEALGQVFRKVRDCRDPGSFLAWCIQIVVNQINQTYRALRKAPLVDVTSEEVEGGAGVGGISQPDENESSLPGRASPPNGARVVIERELTQVLITAIKARLRSQAQQQVLLLGFIGGLDDQQIAKRLNTTPANVHTLRCRALKRLRQDRELIATLKAYVEEV